MCAIGVREILARRFFSRDAHASTNIRTAGDAGADENQTGAFVPIRSERKGSGADTEGNHTSLDSIVTPR
jgi:hypothetical protein